MTKKFNEKGITLVELLAALALFGVISVLIWNLFFQALNFNDRAVTQNQLQQEANLIVNTIQQIHTKYTITSITNINDTLTVNYDDNKHEDFDKENIKYLLVPKTINPNKEFIFDLTLESRANSSIKFNVKTTFSKLAGKNQ
ncbi:prepilin-type N-terminal cleavage/methylation domain-containing protein [Psychrobacillus insolitus]|uniref:Prepilin-type N-terminal cleavage/methylation domain-containing protein n=1 Tax=Psychrobacillus insolitus TaxID=1461 RepID=A0A2W7MIC1_9BACI|nr:prepilin-type N-terminal cleavage/methylation domain-containing protein [Psychrobacillus insolitus]PZX07072.1 prepilin-type N-terminal cleavage/methylation domain-containing protein [Psychrobacillus insolitus]